MSRAEVLVADELVGEIERGLCVLLSVAASDDEAVAKRLAARVAKLRIFPDDAGRMNLDVSAIGGAVLVVSQFTLHANTSRGHRPSFVEAGPPDMAEKLCDAFADAVRGLGLEVATGRFGAYMEVNLSNDGPVTLVLASHEGPWNADAG